MSETFITKVVVLRETESTLTIMCEDSPVYSNISPRYGLVAKRAPVKINKKHVLPGSDNLGRPDDKEEEEENPRVVKGTLILPKWIATQRAIWDRRPPEVPENAAEEAKEVAS